MVAAAFFWNEARKEIVFLCGNFKAGVSEESVRRQLDTGELLRYRSEQRAEGERIIVYSTYNFNMHTCMIDLDEEGEVMQAWVD